MNLKFEKLAQEILGEVYDSRRYDQPSADKSKSAFRKREMNAGEVRGKGPERPFVVLDGKGEPVANYKTRSEAEEHAKKIGGRVTMARS